MLEIIDLEKDYGGGFSLSNICMEIENGEWAVLFGEDDAGKTALLYNILQLHHFKTGQILYQDKPVQKLDVKTKRTMRFVPDDIYLEAISAEEYFEGLLNANKIRSRKEMETLCESFSIDMKEKFPDMTYEGNKLATIVGALITKPEFLILDEPFNFLTEKGKQKLLEVLKEKNKKGLTILLTNECYSDVQGYCNKFFYMKNGSITASGTIHSLLGNAKAVTVMDGDKEILRQKLGEPIAEKIGKTSYLYINKEDSMLLADILTQAGVTDFEVENLTLEEILDDDYSRWL